MSERTRKISKTKKSPKQKSVLKKNCKNEIKKIAKNLKSKGSQGSTKIQDEKKKQKDQKPTEMEWEIQVPNVQWEVNEYLADSENLSLNVADNIIKLFEDECTIPFIARYRSDLTEGLTPDQLRKVKSTYENILKVRAKANDTIKKISKQQELTESLKSSILNARTLEELDFIEAPFKSESKRTLAEKAKELGLEEPANHIMRGDVIVHLERYVVPSQPGLSTVKDVRLGIQHIIAGVINKTSDALKFLDKIKSSREILLQSKFTAQAQGVTKYDLYGNFSQPVRIIKPHQTLAINRGESEKILSVKVHIPDQLWFPLTHFFRKMLLTGGTIYDLRTRLVEDSIDDAIKRFFSPYIVRRVRAQLKKEAEDEAVNLFANNLRQLLLVAPCPEVVLAIDPGLKNGCKIAVVSITGEPIAFSKIFLHQKLEAKKKIVYLVDKYNCRTFALGDGTGSRETEKLLSEIINSGIFKHDVTYTFVSEQGISIYSCSPIASEEFPNLEPLFLSAVSLARRLQNPLSEFVKVEPKHLGVGMYQHDINERKLDSALEEVVTECVSFVGVDVNSASLYLLRRVAGLTEAKAKEIIKYRNENCPFRTREDLKKVKGIKEKTFLQCAGFIRIVPSTAGCKRHLHSRNELNPLDETSIHPESYEVAKKIIIGFGLNLDNLGTPEFCETVKRQSQFISIEQLAQLYNCSVVSVNFIIDRLSQPRDYDQKSLCRGPIFLKKIVTFEELKVGQNLQGVVKNVVPFGAFVDIGVGSNGLIHNKAMRNQTLNINDRVNVQVESVDSNLKRVGLQLISVIKD